MRRAFGKTVLSIVVFFLIFYMIGAPNASVESVTSSSSSGLNVPSSTLTIECLVK